MYVAKDTRSGFAIFDPTFDQHGHERLSLMSELRNAIEHNELVLFYQPKVGMATGTLGSVEALVRWRHPQRGMVSPGEFIPFAENTGFIREITRWAIEAALKQRLKWGKDGLPLSISVNISARDLMKTDFPEMVVDLLGRYGASPGWLTLEITESAVMGDPKRALNVLERLHGFGLRLSVDDFGIGYSSLAYLKKLPVSELKIDMSFVRNMDHDKDDETIVRSTIDLGHNMGLTVVAEGVETEAIWNMLGEMGCDVAQGYYLSRPLDADALTQWIGRSAWRVPEEG
jgi:EAL domain-containing protein (putative c-di-GMP-specific phosphodiesterase class I)